MKRIILAATIITTLTACAWWQHNKGKINCAAIVTVENAPVLIGIVTACAAISVSVAAVLPCIEAAAGSQWAEDVVACFAADGAGLVTCPAARPGTMRATPANAEAQERLRAAVQAKYGDGLQ